MARTVCIEAAAAAIERFAETRVLVIGDVMLDRYVHGTVERISPEAPVPVVRRTQTREALGGAGNVAENLLALGAEVALVGLVGRDEAGRAIAELCRRHARLSCRLISDPDRVTTLKTRVIGQSKQMIRIDDETAEPASAALERRIVEAAAEELKTSQVVILSDYAKGVLTREVCARIIRLAREAGRFVIVDPKTRDLGLYAGASLVCPNLRELHEVTQILAKDDETAGQACQAALDRFDIGAVVLTRSEAGMTLLERGATPEHMPARRRAVGDVSGAGDTAISAIAASLAAGLPLADAVALGNAAAGIAVSKPGTSTVSADELRHELGMFAPNRPVSLAGARSIVQAWREAGKRIGFTNGCFDLLHLGHLQAFETAKSYCDMLVVGVNSDRSVRTLKGPDRPYQDQETRARVIACLSYCDLVVVFDEDTPRRVIETLEPDIVFKGADYGEDDVVGADIVKARGGRVLLTPLVPGLSTTATIARIRSGDRIGPARAKEDALATADDRG